MANSVEHRRGGRTALASLAALGSVIAASSCCLPVIPFVFAAGLAGFSARLVANRPYLLIASVLFVGYGFYEARHNKGCERKPSILSTALLWISALMVTMSILFPELLAHLTANLIPR